MRCGWHHSPCPQERTHRRPAIRGRAMGTSSSAQPPAPGARGEHGAERATLAGQADIVPPGGEPPEFLASMRSMYGPEVRFLGCPAVDLRDADSLAKCDV